MIDIYMMTSFNGFHQYYQYFLHLNMIFFFSFFVVFAQLIICNTTSNHLGQGGHDYREALNKSIIYFQGQRSGKLPHTPRDIPWRGDSGLTDGQQAGVDLTGGYYDAGDNVKFNLPMAFTVTMLSWTAIEYSKSMGDDQLIKLRDAIKWGTDYLLKCALATPGVLYVQVADPNKDHICWERPEDMDTDRSVHYVSPTRPGSDVAGETAAALAAASIVFRKVDLKYSKLLLKTAKDVMQFAMDHRGRYSDSLANVVCPFYCSYSGYLDELLWGGSWLLRATNDTSKYLNFINSLGANDEVDFFGWDNKYAGARVLLSRGFLLEKEESVYQRFSQQAENFMCKILPDSPYSTTQYTQGGLMYKMDGENLQCVTAISFLLTTYANYMATSKHTFSCGSLVVTPKDMRSLVKNQMDYILGDNPMGMSYMVNYGDIYPLKIHHRGSSLPSINVHPNHIPCGQGFAYMYSSAPNPNILTGAIVGGPDRNDRYADDRTNAGQSEPSTYYTATIVGPLSYLAAAGKHD